MAEAKGQTGAGAKTGSGTNDSSAPQDSATLSGDRELYAGYDQLPVIKRTWFWVLAGLLILVSGIVIGLALAKLRPDLIVWPAVSPPPRYAGNELVIASLETQKIRSRRQISELEKALRGNVCTASFQVPGSIAGVVPGNPSQTPVGNARLPSLAGDGPAVPTGTGSGGGANSAGVSGKPISAQPDQTASVSKPATGAQSPDATREGEAPSPAANSEAANNTNPNSNSSAPPATAQPDPASASASPVLKIKDLRVLLNNATVLVAAPKSSAKISIGSGFFINKNHIITNAHVIGRSRHGITITNQSLGRKFPATVIHKVYTKKLGGPDFAILKLSEPLNVTPLKLTKRVTKLQAVIAAGYPGFDLRVQRKRSRGQVVSTFTRGSVRFVRIYEGKFPAISHDADIRRGNSGGPLVDVCGRVLGVNTFALRDNNEAGQAEIDFALSAAGLMQELKNKNVPFEVGQGECE